MNPFVTEGERMERSWATSEKELRDWIAAAVHVLKIAWAVTDFQDDSGAPLGDYSKGFQAACAHIRQTVFDRAWSAPRKCVCDPDCIHFDHTGKCCGDCPNCETS